MQSTLAKTRRARRSAGGFTLVEILISLGIFLIGMTAVVSLFPAAAILQRETTQEVIADLAAESARSIINANQLTNADLSLYHANAGPDQTDVVPLRTAMGTTSFDNRFPYLVRSYPTGLVDTSTGLSNFDRIKVCDMHWVPFIQDLGGNPSNPNWVIRLFIVEHDSRGNYVGNATNDANPVDPNNFPKVRRVAATATGSVFTAAGTDIEAGDIVMDNNGNYHTVVTKNGNAIEVLYPIPQTPSAITRLWYAPRGGASNSPAQRVITVEVNLGQ